MTYTQHAPARWARLKKQYRGWRCVHGAGTMLTLRSPSKVQPVNARISFLREFAVPLRLYSARCTCSKKSSLPAILPSRWATAQGALHGLVPGCKL